MYSICVSADDISYTPHAGYILNDSSTWSNLQCVFTVAITKSVVALQELKP